jgi:hypothetical protein
MDPAGRAGSAKNAVRNDWALFDFHSGYYASIRLLSTRLLTEFIES